MVLQVLETLNSKLICSPFFDIFLGVTLVSLILQLKVTLVALESDKVFCCYGQVLTWGRKSITLYPGGKQAETRARMQKFSQKYQITQPRHLFVCLDADPSRQNSNMGRNVKYASKI